MAIQWNSARVKVQLRLAAQRLKTLQEKRESLAKASRRDIATLVERGKIETARIKVESLINDDIHLELLELLELYAEIIVTRFGLIENSTSREPDPGVSEAISGVVYAAHRTEVKELQYVRECFMHRYGRDWSIAVMENHGNQVSERVLSKVSNDTPSPVLVDAYVSEIARGYGITWIPPDQEDSILSGAPPKLEAEDFLDPPPEKQTADPPSASAKVGESSASGSNAATTPASLLPSTSTPRVVPGSAPTTSAPSTSQAPSSSSGTGRAASPPPYTGPSRGVPTTAPGKKPATKAPDDEDEDDDFARRFAALSGRKFS